MHNIKIQYEYASPTVISWCMPITNKATQAEKISVGINLFIFQVKYAFGLRYFV